MNYQPLRNDVFVRPDPAEAQGANGFFMPVLKNQTVAAGVVVKTAEVAVEDYGLEEGVRVIYKKADSLEIDIDGEKIVVVSADNIVAASDVINEESN